MSDLMAEKRYRCGLFLNPQENDPWFTDQAACEKTAKEMSVTNNGAPVAVWDDSDNTLRLFAGYEEFVPAN